MINRELYMGARVIRNFCPRVQVDISLVRYRVEHEDRNSTSPSNHLLFCLLYKRLTNKKEST